MNQRPDFYLTAAGEYNPLAEPRACFVSNRLQDSEGNQYVVVELRPPLDGVATFAKEVRFVILSARHRGDSISPITSWPLHVYVSTVPGNRTLKDIDLDREQFEVIAWARLYPCLEDVIQDARRHKVAVQGMRPPETLHVAQVRFLGEHDGIPERVLKDQLTSTFEGDERLWKAYLARVDRGSDTTVGVTLCLRVASGSEAALVKSIGEVFAALFRSRETLDILFLDTELDRELARVCKPFYVRTVARQL